MKTSYKKARHAAPSDRMSSFKKFTAVSVVGIIAAASVISAASDGKTAYITDQGISYTVAADSSDLNDVLAEAGITLETGDEALITEESGGSINIDIKRAFPVKITAYGSEKELSITGGTVGDTLKKAGIDVSVNDFVTPSTNAVLSEASEITVVKGVKIYLEKDGETDFVYVPDGTVKEALENIGCELSGDSRDKIKENARIESGMTLSVDEVLYRTTFKTEKLEPKTIEEKSSALPEGETKVKQEGREGKIEISYKEKYVNGVLSEKKEDKKTVVTEAVDRVVLVGTKKADQTDSDKDKSVKTETEQKSDDTLKAEEKITVTVTEKQVPEISAETEEKFETEAEFEVEDETEIEEDDGEFSYSRLITGECTAYTEPDGITATGTIPRIGTVAVNPNVIPYGTKLYICSADGSFVYGYAVAEDTGSACMAGDIVVDLYMNSEAECESFGRQELNIYILD